MGADFYLNPPTRPPSLREAVADQPKPVLLLLLRKYGPLVLQQMLDQVCREHVRDPVLALTRFPLKDIESF